MEFFRNLLSQISGMYAKDRFNGLWVGDTNLDMRFVVKTRTRVNLITFDKNAFDGINRWFIRFHSNFVKKPYDGAIQIPLQKIFAIFR